MVMAQLGLEVMVSFAAGMAVFLGALWLMKVEELQFVIGKMAGKFRKRPATV